MNKKKYKNNLTTGSIGTHLLKMSFPTMGGMLALTIFNLTDTFFVSKLGTNSLAAMGYTFPIVLIIGSISSGMSMGAGSVVARAIGKKDHHLMNRAVTDGILLAVLTVIIITILGLLTLDPLFRLLGANDEVLPLVKEYMFIWYLGSIVIVMPPVTDAAMRSIGDMKRPLLVMLLCAITNIILDPILIFGLYGAPKMGIKGAAIATIISRFMGMILTLSFVHFHYRLISFKYNNINELFVSWKKILHVGITGAVIRLFPQLLRSIMTALASFKGGTAAVAAIAVGTRIESFGTIASMAVGASLVPLVGQNWGANIQKRIDSIRKLTIKLAIIYSLVIFLITIPLAGFLSSIFSDDSRVILLSKYYIWIIIFGSIGVNLYNWTSESLNAAGRPKWVFIINVFGTVIILLPFMVIGSLSFGYIGMLIGLSISQIILGYFSIKIGRKQLKINNGYSKI